jgi:hypothetical protein
VNALRAIARATVAEAVRSRVLLGLVIGLALALVGLAVSATGDGTEVGRARAFVAKALDATWALLALAAVFLSATSLAREIEDGRAIPVAVTPVRSIEVLAGKWLGLGLVLATVLAGAMGATVGVLFFEARRASPEGREQIERELMVSRNVLRPPKLDAKVTSSIELDAAMAVGAEPPVHLLPLLRARQRLEQVKRQGALPPGTKEEKALAEIYKDEVVRALSVGPQKTIRWRFGPLDPAPDAESITIRYRYRILEALPPGQGPAGAFSINVIGTTNPIEKGIRSAPDAVHEMPAPAELLREPVSLASPLDGTVQSVDVRPDGERRVNVDGTVLRVPPGFKFAAAPGQAVRRGQVLATSEKIFLEIVYRNLERTGVTVVFTPEGIELLYVDRPFATNVVTAFVVILGRLLFLLAVGLAASTFLDGKVAALATFFVLAVAAGHGFLDDAVGPILATQEDNVFGILDVPVKAILRAVLLALPDLGAVDPSVELAQGRNVAGALATASLALGSAILGLGAGALALARRELGGGAP